MVPGKVIAAVARAKPIVSPSMPTEPEVEEGDLWEAVLDEIDCRIAMLTAEYNKSEGRNQKVGGAKG